MKQKTITVTIVTTFKSIEGGIEPENLPGVIDHEINSMGMYFADNAGQPTTHHSYTKTRSDGTPLYDVSIDIQRTEE